MMKHVILMRHAKAQAQSSSGEDFDRELTQRGELEAITVAQALKSYGLKPDLALVSSAKRTLGTFDQVKSVMGDIKAHISDDLYNADASSLGAIIQAHEEDCHCLLLIAHNPGVQYLVGEYLNQGAAGFDIIAKINSGFPTAAACVFAVDVAGRLVYDGLYLAKETMSKL